jgi:hypothetical protein
MLQMGVTHSPNKWLKLTGIGDLPHFSTIKSNYLIKLSRMAFLKNRFEASSKVGLIASIFSKVCSIL